jgi:hypothetical protein
MRLQPANSAFVMQQSKMTSIYDIPGIFTDLFDFQAARRAEECQLREFAKNKYRSKEGPEAVSAHLVLAKHKQEIVAPILAGFKDDSDKIAHQKISARFHPTASVSAASILCFVTAVSILNSATGFEVAQFEESHSYATQTSLVHGNNDSRLTWQLCHDRLAHMSYTDIQKMKSHGMLDGLHVLGPLDQKPTDCNNCPEGKMQRPSLAKASPIVPTGALSHLSADWGGPMPCDSINGNKYFLLIKCKFTQFRVIYFMKDKKDCMRHFDQFFIDTQATKLMEKCSVELLTSLLVTDNDSTFLSKAFQDYLHDNKIAHFTSAPYQQSQNFVERDMRTIGEAALTIMRQSGAPLWWWEQAFSCAVYARNRSYTSVFFVEEHRWMSPFQRVFGQVPTIHGMIKFGSKAFVFVDREQQGRQKLDAHAWIGFFVGYAPRSKAYMIYHPVTHKLYCRYHCWFNETIVYGDLYGEARAKRELILRQAQEINVIEQKEMFEFAQRHPRSEITLLMQQVYGSNFQMFADPTTSLAIPHPDAVRDQRDPGFVSTPGASNYLVDSGLTQQESRQLQRQRIEMPGRDLASEMFQAADSGRAPTRARLEPQRFDPGSGPDSQWESVKESNASGRFIDITSLNVLAAQLDRDLKTNPDCVQGESVGNGQQRFQDATRTIAGDNHSAYESNADGQIRVENYVDPKSIGAALKREGTEGQMFRDEAIGEMKFLYEHDVIEQVDASKIPNVMNGSCIVMDSGWVCHMKFKNNGSADRARMRLTPRGYQQREGAEFEKHGIFSPVCRKASLYVLFGIKLQLKLMTRVVDIVKAFLYGQCREECYLKVPQGFNDPTGLKFGENTILRIKKQIYGMKAAAREFFNVFRDHLHGQGFYQLPSDCCVFCKRVRADGTVINPTCKSGSNHFAAADHVYFDFTAPLKDGEQVIFIALWVDDCIIMHSKQQLLDDLLGSFSNVFLFRDEGEWNYLLGMNVEEDTSRNEIRLSHKSYLHRVINAHETWVRRHEKSVPADPKTVLTKDTMPTDDAKRSDPKIAARQTQYRSALGALVHTTNWIHAELAYAVSVASQYMSNPGDDHIEFVSQIMQYCRGVQDMSLVIRAWNSADPVLYGFCDADYAQHVDSRRSRTGYCWFFCGILLSWCSKLQNSVTLSTAEAEYQAICAAVQEAVWLVTLLSDLGLKPPGIVPLFSDNQAAIAISHNPVSHKYTKHIDIRAHFVRELVERKFVQVLYVESAKNVADIFTKALAKSLFRQHRDALTGFKLHPGFKGVSESDVTHRLSDYFC